MITQHTPTDPQSYAFGELLKTYRKLKKISQQALADSLGLHRNTVVRWERGDCLPTSKTIVLEAARQLNLSSDETRHLLEASLTAVTPHWHLPHPRNPFFTGRAELLRTLSTHLHPNTNTHQPTIVALSGIGGIGKTQTAIEYAYHNANTYTAIFWLNADSTEQIHASLIAIAHHLNLPETQQQAQHYLIIPAVLRWLTTHHDWLLILDNVEDTHIIQPILSAARHGSILFTTRKQAPGITAHIFRLPPLTHTESLHFLYHRANLLPTTTHTPSPTNPINPINPTPTNPINPNDPTSSDASTLITLLEQLPLALDQAAAYIDETGCTISDYLTRYQHYRKHLLAHRGTSATNHPDSVSTTIQLAITHITSTHPEALNLLHLCAFLHPDAIPEELLTDHTDLYQLDQTLAALRGASLITRNPSTKTISLHRLVQAVIQDHMTPTQSHHWHTHALNQLNTAFPPVTFNTWPLCARYLPHILTSTSPHQPRSGSTSSLRTLLHKAGTYLIARGLYAEAEPLITRAISLTEQELGPDHPELILQLLALSEIFWRQGTCHNPPLIPRALAICEQHLPPHDPLTAETLNYLAIMHASDGDYTQAVQFCQRALHIHIQHFGPHHHETALTLYNLASLHRDQGHYSQAEPLYHQALHILTPLLEPNHPHIGYLNKGLAILYHHQNQLHLALPHYQRALTIFEQHLGQSHHCTIEMHQAHKQVLHQLQNLPHPVL